MVQIRSRELKIILDPMYGVSKTSLQTILLTARCEVDVIHDRHDTLFGQDVCRHPIWKRWAPCATQYSSARADIGIATDGDADRLELSTTRASLCTRIRFWLSCIITC